jgi:hypothetical protein
MTDMKLRLREKHVEILIILLFALASLFYINIDKVPLSHPGNIKAADPFYHALIAEGIVETGQWNYYDVVFSTGQEKAANAQPPLYYMSSAILSVFSGVPVWSTLYILVCMAQAFLVLLIYLITFEIFGKRSLSLIAAGLIVLPIPVRIWLYGMYIGLWIQVAGYFFMLAFAWLYIRYIRKQENWILFFMGLCISSLMLLHPQDLGFLILPVAVLWLYLLYREKMNLRMLVPMGLIFGLIPLITFFTLLPRFLFVWGAQGGGQYNLGYYGFRNLFPREYSGGMVFPDMFFLPSVFIWLFIGGLILVLVILILGLKKPYGLPYVKPGKTTTLVLPRDNSIRKMLLVLIVMTAYYFAVVYLSEVFVEGPYYFARARSLQAFIIMPYIALSAYFAIQLVVYALSQANRNISRLGVEMAIGMLVVIGGIAYALPQYNALEEQMRYEHIPLWKWEAYSWIHDNTDKTETVLFFGSVFQQEFIYSKRINALFEMHEMQRLVNEYIETGVTPTDFNVQYGGATVRAILKYEKSFWEYGDFKEPQSDGSIYDFDYVIFKDISPEVAQVNRLFAQSYIDDHGFRLVYNRNGVIIIKNER